MNDKRKNIKLIIIIFIVVIAIFTVGIFVKNQYSQTHIQNPPTGSDSLSGTNNNLTTKIYKNTGFGFEFKYPADWTLHENTFTSPASKFNLIGASPKEKGNPNPVIPSFLINIVTPEFGERAFYDLEGTDINVAGIPGKKYEYEFESVSRIAIDIPFKEYHVLFGAGKQYEDVFNQILASFKFLK
jgi:hypothetical protein